MKKLSLVLVLIGIAIVSSSFIEKPVRKAKNKSLRSLSKSLAFPVAGKRSNIGSYWGASRGGGSRSHEGIDIFAKKGTPVVAVTNGTIVSRGRTPKGGKVLWLKPAAHSWSAYYAHLDKWQVKDGQYVRKGQVIGTVGNTGNARHTPSHLHFGIYSVRGPVNPLPYVKHSPKVAIQKAVTKKKAAAKKLRSKKQTARR